MRYKITSRFQSFESFRKTPHNGIDFKMEEGEPLYSFAEGKVRLADYGNENAGKTVFVDWGDGKTAIYGHLSKFAVKDGDIVQKGELVGYAGNTGFSTGSHLHFGLKQNGKFIDPSPYIDDIQNMGELTIIVKEPVLNYNILDLFKIDNGILNSFIEMFS